ncbi:MAG TPA: hypothetical protein VEA18_01915, partial [Candidatus Kapabacteria bacterium]|nr:hypothetical protein [Candidatus Kapabacteria bacterium]
MNNVRTVRFGLIGIGLLSLAGSLASFSPTVVETLTPLGPKDVVHSIAEAFLFGRGGELVENRLHQGEVEHVLAQLGAPISRRYRRPLAEVERMNIEV